MSGTSMDGVDAALCEFVDGRLSGIVQTHTTHYSETTRGQLLRLQSGDGGFSIREFAALDQSVATAFAEAAIPLCESQKPIAIGSHGQTVFHDAGGIRNSLQFGNPSFIAAKTSVPVVADFRRADMALGGQGAPLVPAFHQFTFSSADEARCIVNIGGIANVTTLSDSRLAPVRGWDTGPGNGLMNEWIELQQKLSFDRDGAWAASGTLNEALLDVLLRDEYFNLSPPKSTGRDYFNLAWVRRRFTRLQNLPPADIQRSFCELTAQTISRAISQQAPPTRRVLICGGGARNSLLMSRLRALLPEMRIEPTDAHQLAAEWVEAAAFAWLAMRRIKGLPGSLPEVTGASRAAVLGGVYSP